MLIISVSLILSALVVTLSSPILALGLGATFSILGKIDNRFYTRVFATRLLQTGIILIGLSINAVEVFELTKVFFPILAFYVSVTFLLGLLLGRIFRIGRKFSLLIASGTAICGGTAMAAVAPIIRSRPADLATGITIVFLLNAMAIAFFPMLGKLLGFSELQFGAWAALAIHDTSAVLGASLNYGPDAVDSATTIKMMRTLFLVPLTVFLIFFQRDEIRRIPFPFFVLLFSISVGLGSLVDLPVASSLIRDASQVFLLIGFFAVGTQISKEAIQELKLARLLSSITLWALIIPISYLFVGLGGL